MIVPKQYTSLFWLLIKMSFFTKRSWQPLEAADLGIGYVFVYFYFSICLFICTQYCGQELATSPGRLSAMHHRDDNLTIHTDHSLWSAVEIHESMNWVCS